MLVATSPRDESEEGKRQRNAVADRLVREGMSPYAEEIRIMPSTYAATAGGAPR